MLLMPGLAAALYAAGTDNYRLARTRDRLVLTVRAVREGLQVLRALDVSIVPPRIRAFRWLPEPVLVALLRRLVSSGEMEVAMVGHANAARDEMQDLTDDFRALAVAASVPTPAIDRLYPHLDPGTPLMPDGSAEIPLLWGGVGIALGMLAGLVLILALLLVGLF